MAIKTWAGHEFHVDTFDNTNIWVGSNLFEEDLMGFQFASQRV